VLQRAGKARPCSRSEVYSNVLFALFVEILAALMGDHFDATDPVQIFMRDARKR